MINSRSIDQLTPETADLCRKFIALCKLNGVKIIVTSTYRDTVSQNALYAQGRTAPGRIVTRCKGGDSFHNYHMAFDIVPVVNGKADFNNRATFEKCGILGESLGLVWGGRFTRFPDYPHFQNTGGETLAEFKAGFKHV